MRIIRWQKTVARQVGCAKAILEQAEVPLKNYLVITDLDIEKNKNFNLESEDIAKVKVAVQKICEKGENITC